MDSIDLAQRLSRIQTYWTLIWQAHQGPEDDRAAARRLLLLRYYGAVYRYLLGMLRDPDAAEELSQEFAVRFLRGDFQRADPQRGRFRDFLKTAVRHLAISHWARARKENAEEPLPDDGDAFAAGDPEGPGTDAEFLESWREELMARTWEALADTQREAGVAYYAVLRFKAEHPQARSAEMAQRLSPQLGKDFTEAGVRQALHRARRLFADLLVEEVARSLPTPDADQLGQELIDLGLLDYCRSALQRRCSS